MDKEGCNKIGQEILDYMVVGGVLLYLAIAVELILRFDLDKIFISI